MKGTNKERMKFKKFVLHPAVNFFVEMVFIFSSYFLATNQFYKWEVESENLFVTIVFYLWIVAVILKVLLFGYSRITYKKFKKIELSDKLSSAMLKVEQRANAYKTRHVLQITYGNVPLWHPFNFYENVLVYDVHEQIRTTLLELKNAILSMTPGLDDEAVTVDLVYCYPDDKYSGQLPAEKDDLEKWKLITSRDGSSMNYRVHDFLASKESFYFLLSQNNYVFFNDKRKEERYYIATGKDHEYGGTGSAVGLSINVKNDMPEKILVKAMITITTYGRKLRNNGDSVKEKDYAELFKTNVLDGYKSLLESELSQMYIRHMIREGGMCPYSGVIVKAKEVEQPETAANSSQKLSCPRRCPQRICKYTKTLQKPAVDGCCKLVNQ